MNGLMIKAICIMTLLTVVPAGAYVSNVYEEELQAKETEAIYQEYNEGCDLKDSAEELTAMKEREETAWDYESAQWQDCDNASYEYEVTETYECEDEQACAEAAEITENSSIYAEDETFCVPTCSADNTKYVTLHELTNYNTEYETHELTNDNIEYGTHESMNEENRCEEEKAEEAEEAITELIVDEEEQRLTMESAEEDRIFFEVEDVQYGDDKVWLSATVFNPNGAHITSAGFYATTPAGAHAGDEEYYIDTNETEFDICFVLEGFSNAVMMGPDYKYSFYVISNGEKIRSSEYGFRFE